MPDPAYCSNSEDPFLRASVLVILRHPRYIIRVHIQVFSSHPGFLGTASLENLFTSTPSILDFRLPPLASILVATYFPTTSVFAILSRHPQYLSPSTYECSRVLAACSQYGQTGESFQNDKPSRLPALFIRECSRGPTEFSGQSFALSTQAFLRLAGCSQRFRLTKHSASEPNTAATICSRSSQVRRSSVLDCTLTNRRFYKIAPSQKSCRSLLCTIVNIQILTIVHIFHFSVSTKSVCVFPETVSII